MTEVRPDHRADGVPASAPSPVDPGHIMQVAIGFWPAGPASAGVAYK